MSYITRTGNLAETPTLRNGESGPYTYARVIVTDRVRNEEDEWVDGPAVGYDVAVSGDQARRLVEAAERGGNIRVMFAGRYRVTAYNTDQGTRLQHEVRADEIGVSLRGQDVTVGGRDAASSAQQGTTAAGPVDSGWQPPF